MQYARRRRASLGSRGARDGACVAQGTLECHSRPRSSTPHGTATGRQSQSQQCRPRPGSYSQAQTRCFQIKSRWIGRASEGWKDDYVVRVLHHHNKKPTSRLSHSHSLCSARPHGVRTHVPTSPRHREVRARRARHTPPPQDTERDTVCHTAQRTDPKKHKELKTTNDNNNHI